MILVVSLFIVGVGIGAAPSTRPAETHGLADTAPPPGLRSCDPLAESLEQQVAALPPGGPQRRQIAQRLIDHYRWELGHYSRAAYWVEQMANELRPSPEGIDALFELADTRLNNGRLDDALAVYREILKRIVAPDPPYDRLDHRCWRAWHGERICKNPTGCDPLFRSDMTVTTRLQRFLQLARSGQPAEACALLDQNLPLDSAVQQATDPRRWCSAREWLRQAVAQLPERAVPALEDDCRDRIARLVQQGDWRGLAAFRLHHPFPGLEPQIDVAIGDELLELGLPGLASLFLGQAVRAAGGHAPPGLLAKDLFCRMQAGEQVDLAGVPDLTVEVAGEQRSLRAWASMWQQETGTEPPSPSPQAVDIENALISRLPLTRAPLPLRRWQLRWLARLDPELPDYAPEFTPCVPAGSAQSLVVNVGDAIEAVDVVGGATSWTFLAPEENAMAFPNQKWKEKEMFIECGRARTAAVVGDRVYCLLEWGHHDTKRDAAGLFALRRSDGVLLWSSLQLPELADMQIAADPAVDRGVVVAVAWRPRATLPLFYLVGLSAETGEVLWINHLYSGSSLTVLNEDHFLDRPRACGPPTIADGVAYFSTGAGVAAAVNVIDGTLLWAVEYPRVRAISESAWAVQAALSRPASVTAVMKDVVLFAPIDSHLLIGVDRATGRVRFMQEDLDLQAIAAADDERAYLVEGTTVHAIQPHDARTVWRQTLPTSGIVGLPTLSERGLLCPTWEALYVLDPASGEVRVRRPWTRDEACGYLLDFGDRLVGASRTGLHVVANQPIDEAAFTRLSPPDESTATGNVRVPSREDQWLRWVLPAVNRGDFVLSQADPDHLLIRSELLQMRRMDPIPALCWERPSPLPWDYEVAFDRDHVALWDAGHLFVLDASSGRMLWEDHPPGGLRPVRGSGAELHGRDLLWWGAHQVRCYEAEGGTLRWATPFKGTVRGIRRLEQDVGVYVESPGPRDQAEAHEAVLLDAQTGQERAHFAIPRFEPPSPPPTPNAKRAATAKFDALLVARAGPQARAPAADAVLVDGRLPVRVDWTARAAVPGQAMPPIRGGHTMSARLEVHGDYLCLRGCDDDSPRHNEPLWAVWDGRTLAHVSIPPAQAWCIASGYLYAFSDHRIRCFDLRDGSRRWQTLTVVDTPRVLVATQDHLLALTQLGPTDDRDIQDMSYIRVFDIHNGERVKAFKLPKRWVHVFDPCDDGLVLWDCTFLYHIKAPAGGSAGDPREIVVPGRDADAMAALRLARDLEDPPHVEIAPLSGAPRIDADLSDWPDAPARQLDTVMDFKPDFAHRSRSKQRSYGGKEDLAATVRVGRSADSVYLAVQVTDDVHSAAPGPGLWRSDSITLLTAWPIGEEIDPVMLTMALVNGTPRFEFGTAVSTVAVSDSPGVDPASGPGPRSLLLPTTPVPGAAVVQPGGPVDIAIWRDESSRQTTYELRVPASVLPPDPNLLWDLLINDNDGRGREGALQIASSVWGIEETVIGSVHGAE